MPVDLKAWIKPAAYISLASLSCILFTAYTPPLLSPASAAVFPFFGGLPYERAAYWIRFALSFV
ncbi:MAG: hypothetical protein Q8M76_09565, partial [Spirochaetaceae bacterium]|nr:hypothetical protein [Spirochaetaceae bacterium]